MAPLVFVLLIVEMTHDVANVDTGRKLDAAAIVDLIEPIKSDNARGVNVSFLVNPSQFAGHSSGSFDQHIRFKKIDISSCDSQPSRGLKWVVACPSRAVILEEGNDRIIAPAPKTVR